jgi:hypothetical protein
MGVDPGCARDQRENGVVSRCFRAGKGKKDGGDYSMMINGMNEEIGVWR